MTDKCKTCGGTKRVACPRNECRATHLDWGGRFCPPNAQRKQRLCTIPCPACASGDGWGAIQVMMDADGNVVEFGLTEQAKEAFGR